MASPLRTPPMITRSEVGEYGCWAFVPGCFRCRDRRVNPIFGLIRRSSRPDAAFQWFRLAKHGSSRPGKPLDRTVYPTSRSPSPFAHTLNGSLSHSVAHFRGLQSCESIRASLRRKQAEHTLGIRIHSIGYRPDSSRVSPGNGGDSSHSKSGRYSAVASGASEPGLFPGDGVGSAGSAGIVLDSGST